MQITNTRFLVVGLARTGIAAARFLQRRGAVVRATDSAPESALGPAVAELRALGVRLDLGSHPGEVFESAEVIVLSPGVPHDLPPIREARSRGTPVIGETELAYRFIREPIVAVSGTNGKTTTTELIGRMLAASGRRVFVGGNIGRPLIGYVDAGIAADVVVAEVSSFQLDTIERFRPAVAVLLNITDDHLDRYADFEAYVHSKMRLFENQLPGDFAVLNGADPVIQRESHAIRSRRLLYNAPQTETAAAGATATGIRVELPGRNALTLGLEKFRLRGPHNTENASAAALAALTAGATPTGVQEVLDTFTGLPHRLESVGIVRGVEYVNDSKATNVDAVLRALECFEQPVVLIMGGLDKGGNFKILAAGVQRRVKALVLIGKAAAKIRGELAGAVHTIDAASMAHAVETAAAISRSGDAVLLAPGCASFDMYQNYQARGEDFRQTVLTLQAQAERSPGRGQRPESEGT